MLAAMLTGLAAQLIFVEQLPGINVVLWVALVLTSVWRLRRPGVRMARADLWLVPAAVIFAAFVALRDDLALRLFDLPVAGVLTLAAAVAMGGTPVTLRAWAGLAWLAGAAIGVVSVGATRLSPGLSPIGGRLRGGSGLLRVARGLLVALPLVIVFGALFTAADAVFAAHVEALFALELDLPELVYRAFFAAAAAWLFAGTIMCAWLVRPADNARPAGVAFRLGTVETLVVLLALDVVFAFFVVLQAAYLFGGADTLALTGLSYSEYARRGFFELIAVALLSGTVLLCADWLVDAHSWPYRIAAAALAILSGVVIVSAVVRLGLYQAAYGWTELRFYALVAIAWLAVGVLSTAAGVLADRVRWVPRVLVGAGLLIALAANVVGPQSYVTAQNVRRAIEPSLVPAGGQSGLDVSYLAGLGDDSIPILAAALPQLPAPYRSDAQRLLQRRAERYTADAVDGGWPSWNLARQRAIDALRAGGYLAVSD